MLFGKTSQKSHFLELELALNRIEKDKPPSSPDSIKVRAIYFANSQQRNWPFYIRFNNIFNGVNFWTRFAKDIDYTTRIRGSAGAQISKS